jgi:endonuclease/exonuclease/phosphatase family metal-dependent hydrolase
LPQLPQKEGGVLMRRTLLLLATMALALLLASGVAFSQSSRTGDLDATTLSTNRCLPSNLAPAKDNSPITVMTRNLYLGADLSPIFEAARTGGDVIGATTNAWTTIKATNFPERAEALAEEIKQSEPLLVGLQEVSLYRTQPYDANLSLADHVEYDYLEILLGELNERNLHYAPVVVNTNADAETPGFTGPGREFKDLKDIRLTDRDVILVRTDMPDSKLQLSNPQEGNFDAILSNPIPFIRGWGSIDVTLRGQTFRFINTHLEQDVAEEIQEAQGEEILSGPANTHLPVILVGDFNSRADRTGTDTYDNLIKAGFTDAWSATHPRELGNTWGHDENLLNTTVNLTQRLDLVLFRGNLCALDADVVGEELTDRTPSGLWPSDHAGVVATLRGE